MQNNAARMGEESIARLLIQLFLLATVGMLVMSGLFGLDGVWVSRPLSDLRWLTLSRHFFSLV